VTFGAYGFLSFVAVAGIAAFALAWLASWRMSARARFGPAAPHRLMSYAAPALLIAASAIAAFAAARPQWGAHETQVEERGIDLMIVLDVSNSMRATDAPPTRLQRAQDEIIALLEQMSGDRAGLVIFAGQPFPRSALTADLVALRTIVDGVDEEIALVPPGSDLGAAITRAHEALESGTADTRVLLIVSDGEDHGGRVDEAVAAARSAGIRTYTAGAGTAAGAQVADVDPQTGEIIPRVSNGSPVITRLDAAALEGMATAGGGRYVQLSGEGRPLTTLASDFASLDATTFATETTATPIERFQIFTAIALAIVVVATLLHLVRLPAARGALRLWPVAGASIFIAGICTADAADHNRRGNRHYAAGELLQAVSAYRTAQAVGDAPELYHNAGNALDAAGDHAAAVDETMRGLPVEDDERLEALLEYALGNHFNGAQQLEEALEAYRRSLLAAPDDADAKHNFEVTALRLTPTPSPTATSPAPELPASTATADPTDPGGGGTPGPAGTPQPGASPQAGDPSDIPPEQLERLLEEALRGIDDEFTVEEAIRVLELIEQRNRDALDDRPAGEPGLPDY
jgi:Ca-activated chloride channel family protein